MARSMKTKTTAKKVETQNIQNLEEEVIVPEEKGQEEVEIKGRPIRNSFNNNIKIVIAVRIRLAISI